MGRRLPIERRQMKRHLVPEGDEQVAVIHGQEIRVRVLVVVHEHGNPSVVVALGMAYVALAAVEKELALIREASVLGI